MAKDNIERVYVAGPMRGIDDNNFPAFRSAVEDLRSRGYTVWSPHEQFELYDPTKHGPNALRHYMRVDLPAVLNSDAIVVLPGWNNSIGTRLEMRVARDCGILVLEYPELNELP